MDISSGMTATAPGAVVDPGPHVLIVGGGASGVLMAAHLLAVPAPAFRVTIVEPRERPGCGIAYSTDDPDHLLNTRVAAMSAYAHDPDHFRRWLDTRPEGVGMDAQSFVSRTTYGNYLAGLLDSWTRTGGRVTCLSDSCIGLQEDATGVAATLAGGAVLSADLAILATGHVVPEGPAAQGLLTGAWDRADPPSTDARVLIIGSGLSMVDQVLSMLNNGHTGEIVALSRRGQLPRSHTTTKPLSIAREDVPFGARMSVLFAWARRLAAEAEAAGGTWRDAVDGIRPHVRAIWRSLALDERRRFLRHASIWWDVHRHRIPPGSESRIQDAVARGQLKLERGAFLSAEQAADGSLLAHVHPFGSETSETLTAARIIDCRGIRRDPVEHASPLMAGLFQRGEARVDALRIGLDVSEDCRILDTQGNASARILAIGPVSRSAFWEITAIPDIREQVADVARGLAAQAIA